MGTTQECYMLFWTNPGSTTFQNSCCTATQLPSNKPSKQEEQDMLDTAGEEKNELVSNILQWPPIHGHASVGQPARTYINSLQT